MTIKRINLMKNLLLTTVGNNDQWYKHWYAAKGTEEYTAPRNFDVGLVCYEKTTEQIKVRSDFYFWHLPDFKYPALHQVIANNPFIFDYHYIFMPDDDILMNTSQINTLFEWAAQTDITLAQPSIKPPNFTWPVTLNQPACSHRMVKMIEIMCPLFSNVALTRCWRTFNESYSGWGLDAVWAKLVNYQKIAICDLVTASHEKPMNEGSGRLYEKLRNEKGIQDPRIEMQQLLKHYNAVLDFAELQKIKK